MIRLKLSQQDADTVEGLERAISQGIQQMYNMTTGSRTIADVIETVNMNRRELARFTAAMGELFDLDGTVRIQRDLLDGKFYLMWGE